MRARTRNVLRRRTWALLAVCMLIEIPLSESVISPYRGEIMFYCAEDLNASREIEKWCVLAGFVVFQGLLMFALIRLRTPNLPSPVIGRVKDGIPSGDVFQSGR